MFSTGAILALAGFLALLLTYVLMHLCGRRRWARARTAL
jgi:hypothetical protein